MDQRLVNYLSSIGADSSALDGWSISVQQCDGRDVAYVIQRGPEVHILPLVERRAITRRNLRAVLAPVLATFGYVTTRVPLAETNHRLREKLGFVRTHADETCTYWALTTLPYERTEKGSTPCLSQS